MSKTIEIASLFKTIGKNLYAIRNARRETQEGVAATIGIKHPVISKIENGQYNLTIEMLVKLCNHYEVTIQQVMDLEITQIFHFTQRNESGTHNNTLKQSNVSNDLSEGYQHLIAHYKAEIDSLRNRLALNEPT